MESTTEVVSQSTPQLCLRMMEPADVQALFCIENDPEVWRYTHQGDAPYTREQIEHFVRTAPHDLATQGQLRFVVECESRVVGTVDLYGYDPDRAQAWVGVLVWPAERRAQGIGRAALQRLLEWVDQAEPLVKRLLAQIDPANQASLRLFRSVGFQSTPFHALPHAQGYLVLQRAMGRGC